MGMASQFSASNEPAGRADGASRMFAALSWMRQGPLGVVRRVAGLAKQLVARFAAHQRRGDLVQPLRVVLAQQRGEQALRRAGAEPRFGLTPQLLPPSLHDASELAQLDASELAFAPPLFRSFGRTFFCRHRYVLERQRFVSRQASVLGRDFAGAIVEAPGRVRENRGEPPGAYLVD